MKKLTYEYVKEQIEKERYQLLSDRYENAKTKLKVRCPKGHEYDVKWNDFQQGYRCLKCYGTPKLTYEYVKEQFEKKGYELLSDSYKNAHTKLKVKCPKGHEYKTRWGNFQQGHRCLECSGLKKHSYESIKEQIEKEGYTLLSKEYKNNNTKLKVKCPEGHEYSVIWACFQQGQRCSKCSGNKKLTYDHIKEQIEKEGYKLLSKEYRNAHTKFKVKCPKGHEYEVTWNSFQQRQRCLICFSESVISKPEKEILKYIKTIYNDEIIPNDRNKIINPRTGRNLELDIWLPELNKAIEFNGVYWHSKPRAIKNDKIKHQQCLEKGIDLMIIHEEHWNFNKEKCLDKIREFITENIPQNK